jgi:hypothetical protein
MVAGLATTPAPSHVLLGACTWQHPSRASHSCCDSGWHTALWQHPKRERPAAQQHARDWTPRPCSQAAAGSNWLMSALLQAFTAPCGPAQKHIHLCTSCIDTLWVYTGSPMLYMLGHPASGVYLKTSRTSARLSLAILHHCLQGASAPVPAATPAMYLHLEDIVEEVGVKPRQP